MKIIVTGGCGFIGSSFIRLLIKKKNIQILNIDKLTYAANKNYLTFNSKNYKFYKLDICNTKKITKIFFDFSPDVLVHFAAESHVDNSILNSNKFIKTNIVGTHNLLEISRYYYEKTKSIKKFKFLHISTDEVYGDLGTSKKLFDEQTKYDPSSPYSSSKASSDHLVRSWYKTYKLPILITHCSNNYGPFQNKEKLIPMVINNALKGKKIPIYGLGNQVRDWLYVQDHVEAIYKIIKFGKIGETYNIGGNNQIQNLQVVKMICNYLDKRISNKPKK